MRVALRVSSSNEHWDGGCEFALVDVTQELAALALRRITILRAQKSADPDVDDTYYWAPVNDAPEKQEISCWHRFPQIHLAGS